MTPKPVLVLAAALVAAAANAQTTYRWVDPATGRTVFSDRPPPPGVPQATRREAPAAGGARQRSYAVRVAAEKFPVILYTTEDCAEHCRNGRALLAGRGVPFRERVVENDAPALDELKRLTGGEVFVPVVVVGREHFKGFEAGGWNGLLDLAGYPRDVPPNSRPAPAAAPETAAQETPPDGEAAAR
ncbi:MAG: glutaredoxin family protein [Rhodocyclaceae bacterium]|nr:glutaredoxin family protein [Rhodocyclaceae bacterium]